MADWSTGIPGDLLDRIVNLIDDEIDLLRFRSICTSWRSSALRTDRRHRGRLTATTIQALPDLYGSPSLMPTAAELDIHERTIYLINDTLDLRGWLVQVTDRECNPHGKRLLHPIQGYPFRSDPRGENTTSPNAFDVRKYRVKRLYQLYVLRRRCGSKQYIKTAMKWSSSQEAFVLLAIDEDGPSGGRLVKFESQHQNWMVLDHNFCYQDVIAHKGKLLAVDSNKRCVMVGEDGELIVVANGARPKWFGGEDICPQRYRSKKTLVESKEDGELLLVDMQPLFPDRPSRPTFKVYKLNEEEKKWVDVGSSLGDDVLFIGDRSAFAASLYSDLHGFSAKNCIFFVEDHHVMPESTVMHAFDLEVGDLTTPLRNWEELWKLFWPPPPWLTSKLLHPYVDDNAIESDPTE
ncbi:F-box protein SKIP23 [Linum grandiflorum]